MYEELYQAGAGKWFFKTGMTESYLKLTEHQLRLTEKYLDH